MKLHLATLLAATALFASSLAAQAPKTPSSTDWTQAELERLSREIERQVEVLRGEKFLKPVEVKLATRADLLSYAKLRMERDTPPARMAADGDLAKLLAVFPADQDLLATQLAFLEEQVAGFYDPDTDSFALMDTTPRDLARIVMAHELAHALDDQLDNIDGTAARLVQDTDQQLAFHSVVEGAAMAVMTRWQLEHAASLDTAALAESQRTQLDALGSAPAWLWKPMFAAYMQGAAFLARNDNWVLAQGIRTPNADIRAAFANPPRSTEQVLHPSKYWSEAQRDEPQALDFEVGELPEGWEVRREDTLGELALGIVASGARERSGLKLNGNLAALMGVKFTHELAAGWGGDRVVLVSRGASHVLRWVTRWDSERDAAEFFGALSLRRDEFAAAARVLSNSSEELCDAQLEYGDDSLTVVLDIRAGVRLIEARKVAKALKHVRGAAAPR